MTTLLKAAQQALEALALAQLNGEAGLRDYEVLEIAEAAVALEAALAEEAMQRLTDVQQEIMESEIKTDKAEPVAWMVYTEGGTSAYVTDNPNDLVGAYRALPLYTTPPQRPAEPVQEPVAWALHTGTRQGIKWNRKVEHGTPLYPAPPNCPNCASLERREPAQEPVQQAGKHEVKNLADYEFKTYKIGGAELEAGFYSTDELRDLVKSLERMKPKQQENHSGCTSTLKSLSIRRIQKSQKNL